MTRFYLYILLCLLCAAVAITVRVRDHAIAADFSVVHARLALQDSNTLLLWQKIEAVERQNDQLASRLYVLEHPKPKVKPAPIRKRPVPVFAQGKMFGR